MNKLADERLDELFEELDETLDEAGRVESAIKYTACFSIGVILGFLAAAFYFAHPAIF